jgi:hypothetical protein
MRKLFALLLVSGFLFVAPLRGEACRQGVLSVRHQPVATNYGQTPPGLARRRRARRRAVVRRRMHRRHARRMHRRHYLRRQRARRVM